MNFASDNTAGVHPKVLEAIVAANDGQVPSYGEDPWSHELNDVLSAWFGRKVFVFPVATGGSANALALSQVTPPWGAVFCHRESHIQVDECGAPEFYTGGAKLVTLDGDDGRLTPATLATAMKDYPAGVVHHVQGSAVSITQSSERGLVYQPRAIAALAEMTHKAGLKFHMDGARLANALAHLACKPAETTWQAGVDVLSLGFTKNGALAAESVIFFDEALADGFLFRRKRGGHLFSKMRFMAAQFLAMLKDDLWLELATTANQSATALAEIFSAAGLPPAFSVEANEVFVWLPKSLANDLKADGAMFYPWGPEAGDTALYRFVCSFRTTGKDIADFANRLKLRGFQS